MCSGNSEGLVLILPALQLACCEVSAFAAGGDQGVANGLIPVNFSVADVQAFAGLELDAAEIKALGGRPN